MYGDNMVKSRTWTYILKGMWNDLLHFPVINSSGNMEQFLSLYPVPKARY